MAFNKWNSFDVNCHFINSTIGSRHKNILIDVYAIDEANCLDIFFLNTDIIREYPSFKLSIVALYTQKSILKFTVCRLRMSKL